MEHPMPSDPRAHSSNQEALLLDQALDAVNQRLHSFHQPLALAHKPQQVRSGLVHTVGWAPECGVNFHTLKPAILNYHERIRNKIASYRTRKD
jgi:hypothetical protein